MQTQTGKKLEKLNIRVSDDERELFLRQAAQGGYANVSSWARAQLLASSGKAAAGKPARNVAIYLAPDRVVFGVDGDDFPVEVPTLACYAAQGDTLLAVADAAAAMTSVRDATLKRLLLEGQVIDTEAFVAVLRYGFHQLLERYDLSAAKVLVTGRIVPALTLQMRELVQKATPVAEVRTMELPMALAVGAGIDVKLPVSIPIIVVEDDYIEAGIVYAAGLRHKTSVGTALLDTEAVRLHLDRMIAGYRRLEPEHSIHVFLNEAKRGMAASDQRGVEYHHDLRLALAGVRSVLSHQDGMNFA